MNIKILRDAANSIADGGTELARRAVPVYSTGATMVMDGWVVVLETENEALRTEKHSGESLVPPRNACGVVPLLRIPH